MRDIQAYFAAGVQHVTLRLASWDQRGQLERFLAEVAPAFARSPDRAGAAAPAPPPSAAGRSRGATGPAGAG